MYYVKNYSLRKDKVNALRKEKYKINPELFIARSKKWASDNPDKITNRKKDHYLKNRDRALEYEKEARLKNPGLFKARRRQYKYGLSTQVFEEILLSQGGVCAVCKQKGRFCVDHDHVSNKVRGILCGQCNVALGMLKDSPELALAASKYLAHHKS